MKTDTSMEDISLKISKLKQAKSSADQLLELGNLYLQQKNILEARYYYKQLIQQYPQNIDGYLAMGILLTTQGKSIEANNYLTQAQDLAPESLPVLIALGKLHIKIKGYSKALEVLNKALKLEPNNVEALFLIGYLNYMKFDLFHARHYFEQADTQLSSTESKDELKSSELAAKIQFNIICLDMQQGYYTKAIEKIILLSKHQVFQLDHPDMYYILQHNLGYCYFRDGKHEMAQSVYDKLFEKDIPQQAASYINLGHIYWSLNNPQAAFACFERANQLEKSAWKWMRETKKYLDEGSEWLTSEMQSIPREGASGLNYAMYLGCVIPNRYPYIDAGSRHALNKLGVGIADLEGAGCCPAPGVFRSFDIETWLTLGSRNLIIAEEMNRNLCIMCNGCFGTLNDINTELKEDKVKRDKINSNLEGIGKEFKGTIDAEHILWVLYNDIGIDKIKEKISHKLNLKVAVHYGCHIMKPIHNKPWKDDFEKPTFLDELVELTGCQSVPHQDKLMCCGAGGGLRGSEKEISLDFTRAKLESYRKAGIDIIVDCCPFCHLQLDLGQMEVNNIFKDKISAPFKFPVIYITQLLGLAMGIDPYRLGIQTTPQPKGTPPFTPVDPIFTTFLDELPL